MSSDGPQYPQYPGQDPDEGVPSSDPPPPPPPPPAPDPPAAYGSPAPPEWTPETAGHQIPYASWGLRLGAYLLDALIAVAVMLPFVVASVVIAGTTGEAGELNPDTGFYEGGTVSPWSPILLVLGYVLYFAFLVWNFGMRQGRTGQSLDKSIVNIRVVRMDGDRPLGFWLSIGRTLLFSIITACTLYINALWPLWDAKRQALHDKVVNTVVIRT